MKHPVTHLFPAIIVGDNGSTLVDLPMDPASWPRDPMSVDDLHRLASVLALIAAEAPLVGEALRLEGLKRTRRPYPLAALPAPAAGRLTKSNLTNPRLTAMLFAILVKRLGGKVEITQADIDDMAYNRLAEEGRKDGSLEFTVMQRRPAA